MKDFDLVTIKYTCPPPPPTTRLRLHRILIIAPHWQSQANFAQLLYRFFRNLESKDTWAITMKDAPLNDDHNVILVDCLEVEDKTLRYFSFNNIPKLF